ncbi:hypothetical protein ACRRTK_001117 [Alexandromys fortis]
MEACGKLCRAGPGQPDGWSCVEGGLRRSGRDESSMGRGHTTGNSRWRMLLAIGLTDPDLLPCAAEQRDQEENDYIYDPVHQHVNNEKESSQCNDLGKMPHDPSTCALSRTCEATENSNNYRCGNHREDSIDSSNPDRHESVHTGEEPCKSKDCKKGSVAQDQRVYTAKKEHRQGEYADSFLNAFDSSSPRLVGCAQQRETARSTGRVTFPGVWSYFPALSRVYQEFGDPPHGFTFTPAGQMEGLGRGSQPGSALRSLGLCCHCGLGSIFCFLSGSPVVRAPAKLSGALWRPIMCLSGYTPGAPVNSPGNGDEVMEDRALVKRPLWEETHVCEKCVEFFSFFELMEHKKTCTKNPPVLIMNDSKGPVSSEDFPRAVLSHQLDSPSNKDSHQDNSGNSGNSNICGRAFTTKGNLKVHYMTHEANNNSVRPGKEAGQREHRGCAMSGGKEGA